jgi:hypothetical protein
LASGDIVEWILLLAYKEIAKTIVKKIIPVPIIHEKFTDLNSYESHLVFGKWGIIRAFPVEEFSEERIVAVVSHDSEVEEEAMGEEIAVGGQLHPHVLECFVQVIGDGLRAVEPNAS